MLENIRSIDDATWKAHGGLDAAEMRAIGALNRNRRYNDPGVFTKGMGGFYPIYE